MASYWCVFDPLGENEKKDYTLDFTNELSDDAGTLVDSIATYTITTYPDGLTISGKAKLSDTQIIFYASQPDPIATLYDVVATVTTTVGRTYEKLVGIPTQKINQAV